MQSRPFLDDMLAYARKALTLVGERDGAALASDEVRFLAVQRCIEIIGEAASRTPSPVADALSHIEFRNAAATRHRIVHGYRTIDPDIVARTVSDHFPKLVADLEVALAGQLPDESQE
ncbi:DUF86 domain-containing protein [Alkalicaulis satelles]|uniref:DUF86 domain-containing protein n=1 Tax=Alkalicaulis satelles TaxID=2609175 RepID=A0A5M6ZSS9_9PROT|nr:HepT-like ribonuclease domain-containing protein [Alkalicaulis satelles]KAA5805381.1 DUF86 domain-containing protein [Alkalicaulis satelles]